VTARRPLIAHIVNALDYGGLENGLINLINHLPSDFADHAIISLTYQSDFSKRIRRPGVDIYCLEKPAGQTVRVFPRLWRLLRQLSPTVVHTRNLATLECQIVAALAGVKTRIHGEHGWDSRDPDGTNLRFQRIRRTLKPLVHHHIALSRHIEDYLHELIGVPSSRITRICNGVDTQAFQPIQQRRDLSRLQSGPVWDSADWPKGAFVLGTVGRASPIKNQKLLAEVFVSLRSQNSDFKRLARLVIVGGGALTESLRSYLREHQALDDAWLPGSRDDVASIMQGLDIFVLPSLGEGISNAILEAMACGLPVVAGNVGGNSELVEHGTTGFILDRQDASSYADTILKYFLNRELLDAHRVNSHLAVTTKFSIQTMVSNYQMTYEALLDKKRSFHNSRNDW
jgi:sugar transferase (PEP-CTERM/EpsH1 system associated)